jgi:hypothetical protein
VESIPGLLKSLKILSLKTNHTNIIIIGQLGRM